MYVLLSYIFPSLIILNCNTTFPPVHDINNSSVSLQALTYYDPRLAILYFKVVTIVGRPRLKIIPRRTFKRDFKKEETSAKNS